MPVAQSILITGCSSGIGLCCAHGLRERGHRVFASARREADVAHLRDAGFEAWRLDLDDPDSIATAVDAVLAAGGGRLDALFNNGAYGQPGAVEDLSRAALRAQFETNLFGTVELTNRVLPVMRRQGHGRIIQNSSILGFMAMAYRGAYNASKFALEGITDTLRLELADTGIHVSLIEPGPITSRFRANSHAKFLQYIDAAHSPHRARYAAMEARLTRPGPAAPFTLGPEAVLAALVHALESPRPRTRYRVTVPTVAFWYLRHLLPTRALDWIAARAGGGGSR
ncbi:short-subunit dehydrogenase [Plasticicumulans lactativorans]|uniref:Short-subunit dehydrogenase n=1 Tax=Plasticicumulans lactativorans TaxID=1133106 RepID=A0A4R2KZR7_9GAMM|nr:SDR family oxidoreductase [Plasticicumulans lactativorans]TCO80211.1 short-subunit dehydrogenase [Plasticicumulans lactativorans]